VREYHILFIRFTIWLLILVFFLLNMPFCFWNWNVLSWYTALICQRGIEFSDRICSIFTMFFQPFSRFVFCWLFYIWFVWNLWHFSVPAVWPLVTDWSASGCDYFHLMQHCLSFILISPSVSEGDGDCCKLSTPIFVIGFVTQPCHSSIELHWLR